VYSIELRTINHIKPLSCILRIPLG